MLFSTPPMTRRPLPELSPEEAQDVAIGVMEILQRSYCDEIETGPHTEQDVETNRADAIQLFEKAITSVEEFDRLTRLGEHAFEVLRSQMRWWQRFRYRFAWVKPPDYSKTVAGFRQCLEQISLSKPDVQHIVIQGQVYWCAKSWVDSYDKEKSFQTSPYR